jgi:hypothetical protein
MSPSITYPLPREGVRRLLEDIELVGTIARDQFEKDVRAQCPYCGGWNVGEGWNPVPVLVPDWIREMGGGQQTIIPAWAHFDESLGDRTICRADRLYKANPEFAPAPCETPEATKPARYRQGKLG